MEKRWPDHSLRVGIFFFLYSLGSLALAITCHLRDSQAVASNAVFPATRARAISIRFGHWFRPPPTRNLKCRNRLCLFTGMPRQSTLGFFNRTLSYTSTCTEDNERLRLRVKSMFDKPFSNAVHPENRARKKLRQTFYHSALFVSEKKKDSWNRHVRQRVVSLDNWLVHIVESMNYYFIIGNWKNWQAACYTESFILF